MSILKSRHGKGGGMRIALNWLDSCRFDEVGLICETEEDGKTWSGKKEQRKKHGAKARQGEDLFLDSHMP